MPAPIPTTRTVAAGSIGAIAAAIVGTATTTSAGMAADIIEAAETVAAARVELATAYLRFKAARKNITDTQAMQQAIVETGSALDVALARYEVAKAELLNS